MNIGGTCSVQTCTYQQKVEMFNLENDEIKNVLVMLVALYSLIKVTCTRNILETYLGKMSL